MHPDPFLVDNSTWFRSVSKRKNCDIGIFHAQQDVIRGLKEEELPQQRHARGREFRSDPFPPVMTNVRHYTLLLVLLTTHGMCCHNHQHEDRRVVPKQDRTRRKPVVSSFRMKRLKLSSFCKRRSSWQVPKPMQRMRSLTSARLWRQYSAPIRKSWFHPEMGLPFYWRAVNETSHLHTRC
jgi:hypothetical protein